MTETHKTTNPDLMVGFDLPWTYETITSGFNCFLVHATDRQLNLDLICFNCCFSVHLTDRQLDMVLFVLLHSTDRQLNPGFIVKQLLL